MADGSTPLLIYDGDCSFCAACVNRLAPRLAGPVRVVGSRELSAEERRELGLTLDDVRSAAWWIDESGNRSRGHLAVARALAAGTGWYAVCGRIMLVPPVRRLGALVYPLVACLRHRLPAVGLGSRVRRPNS